mmetsp:Transcript_855/g.1704  ORF Transcript_855/g.1704 Transcript_855/m.1704 type:complete len:200 (-) Transcript_855:700-1299(-)
MDVDNMWALASHTGKQVHVVAPVTGAAVVAGNHGLSGSHERLHGLQRKSDHARLAFWDEVGVRLLAQVMSRFFELEMDTKLVDGRSSFLKRRLQQDDGRRETGVRVALHLFVARALPEDARGYAGLHQSCRLLAKHGQSRTSLTHHKNLGGRLAQKTSASSHLGRRSPVQIRDLPPRLGGFRGPRARWFVGPCGSTPAG